jgi:ribosomal protein S25
MTLSHTVDIIRKDFIELDSSQGQVMPLGGAKKKSLAQMGKTQDQQDKKPEAPKKSKGKPPAEKKSRGVDLPNLEDTRFLSELSKMGAITPYALASQFNLRISVAKDMLEELERKRLVTAVGGNARIRIYKMAAA